MTIGQRIRLKREELGMSQEELALRIGYKSKSSINKIELDVQNLRQTKIKAIADALGVTANYILGIGEDPAPAPAPSITADESDLLTDYRKLNEAGKNLARIQVENLTKIDDYIVKGDGSAGLNSDVG